MSTPVGRLAPSPTGRLHLGHARSFLLAWWHARARGGRVLLRMEDLDEERSRQEHAEGVLRDLEWLGLDWDGPVARQSERAALYAAALARLEGYGLVYPCVCTRREIAAAQSAPHEAEAPYPGTCRGRYASLAAAEADSGRAAALRFRAPRGARPLHDLLAGTFEEDVAEAVGDFPVTRRGGGAAYQLAVVVDDDEQGVTEVLRGDDLLSSTARQAALLDALGLPHPSWSHVPLVQDAYGRRLAKRADDLSLQELRARGADPRAVVGWAATSAHQPGPARGAPAEYLADFDLLRVAREPVRLSAEVLEALTDAR
jgi:glutamyl-tRNA synthetase